MKYVDERESVLAVYSKIYEERERARFDEQHVELGIEEHFLSTQTKKSMEGEDRNGQNQLLQIMIYCLHIRYTKFN